MSALEIMLVAMPDMARLVTKNTWERLSYVFQVDGPSDLHRKIKEHQPDIVVLDWRISGNTWRVIDEVPTIVSKTATHPLVIFVGGSSNESVDREAARRCCYDVVGLTDNSNWASEVAQAIGCAAQNRWRASDGTHEWTLH